MPWSASTNLPVRFSEAPVKEPFSWPNRMLSTRFSGMAPQLTVTKGLALRGAFALDGAGDQLLADARFALDQHRNGRVGGPAAELDHPLHGLAAGDQIGEAELALAEAFMRDQLVGQRLDLERVLDGDFEPLGAHRLDHEVDGAGAHRRDGRIDAAMGGLHDGWRLSRQRAHGGQHGHAVGARHDEVEQDKADFPRAVGLERRKRLVAAIGRGDAIAEPLDGLFENTTLSRVVVDDQYAFGHDARLATLRLNPHDGGQRHRLYAVEARCSCAKIVHWKGKYPLYQSSILVKVRRVRSSKRTKTDAVWPLAGPRLPSHTRMRFILNEVQPTDAFQTPQLAWAPLLRRDGFNQRQGAGEACMRPAARRSSAPCRNGTWPISIRGRTRRSSRPTSKPPSGRPTPCRSAMPASLPRCSTAARAARRSRRPCASSRR